MKKLVAIAPILYKAFQYEVGDVLPDDTPMTETWLENRAAVWKEDDEQPKKAPKAIPMTAEPGMPGLSTTGNPDDLVGKIPKSPLREKPAPRRKKTK